MLALQQVFSICNTHSEALRDALHDLQPRNLQTMEILHPSKEDRRLLDQFAYRYIRLQDDMGARLLPAILRAQEEDIANMATIDRLHRLEQLGWIPSAEHWSELRRIRNEFTHDYPNTHEERFARFQLAIQSAIQVLQIFEQIAQKCWCIFRISTPNHRNRRVSDTAHQNIVPQAHVDRREAAA